MKKIKIINKVRYFFTKKVIIILQYYLAGASVKASLIYSHKKRAHKDAIRKILRTKMFKVQSFQTLQLQPLVFQVSAIAATPIYICKLPSSKRDRSYTENPLTHHLTMGTFKHISQ